MSVFVTGATGLVGMTVIEELIDRCGEEVIALVRAADGDAADERVGEILGKLYEEPGDRASLVTGVAGDVTRPGLGCSAADRERILGETTHIVHSAATVHFNEELAVARQINTAGTAEALSIAWELFHEGRLERMIHVSTAYVSGDWRGTFEEHDLDRGQTMRNTYEQSKLEAELLVAAARADGLPVVTVRPSAIVGDSVTGWTPTFNVLYVPIRLYSRGYDGPIPVDPDGQVDIVPLDYVAQAIRHLLLDAPSPPAVAALVAGTEAPDMREVVYSVVDALGRERPVLSGNDGSLRAEDLVDYVSAATRFGDSQARAALAPHGIAPARFVDITAQLVDYGLHAKWGRSPVSREAAAARLAGR